MMRMSKPLFLLMALFVGTAFAADGTVATRTIPGNLTTSGTAENDTVVRATTRGTTTRSTATSDDRGATRGSSTTTSRGTTSRSTTSRSGATTSRSTTTRATAGATKNTVSRSTVVGDINANPAVRRAGVVLRPSFADFGGRATIAGTGRQTGSNIREDIQKIAGRATTNVQATKESIAAAREKMELTAELNSSCQEQYNECMDQFCSVINENQKRCSCSSNLSKYAKVEKAVTDANNKLNEVAQAIRYVGLSADEIRAIMSETEAEEAMDDNKDTSTTRTLLKQIESMIKDPTSSTTSYASDTGWNLDMDLTFSSDPVDIFNLEFLTTNSNNNSISHLRGTELYNTAKKRCASILTQCTDAGATQAQITGNYDLAIDKDCLAYEAGLKKMNDTLLSNVKSANLMLQKARLAVSQNKNQYDALGCVSALESCMKDDMVCGDDYYKCVDPTKAYIDENGDVVLGQDITIIQAFMKEYNNAEINSNFLSNAYNTTVSKDKCTKDGKCVVKYLLQKIGTKQKSTDEGLCRPVLDKCQYYSYDTKNGKYKPYNDVVVNYIQRAMVNIKSAQQKIISDYASSCIIDVATCYNQQVTQVNSWASAASVSNIYNVMRGACRSVALTCGLAVFAGEPAIEPNTELTVGGLDYSVSGCTETENLKYGSAQYNDAIINCISNMFYQSLLCPDNSSYVNDGKSHKISNNGKTEGWVNAKCQCNKGYDVWAGECVQSCQEYGQTRGANGSCVCTDEGFMNMHSDGLCYSNDGKLHDRQGTNSTPLDDEETQTGEDDTDAEYTLTYRCDGGGNVVAPQKVNSSNKKVTLAGSEKCTATTNQHMVSWGQCGSFGQEISLSESTTCYAKWEYYVTYDCGEAEGNAVSLANPAKDQYDTNNGSINLAGKSICNYNGSDNFTGWRCTGSSSVKNAGDPYSPGNNVACTAQWSSADNTVQITYDCGDGGTVKTGVSTTRNVAKGEQTTLDPVDDICNAKSGKRLTKWSCDPNENGYITTSVPVTCIAGSEEAGNPIQDAANNTRDTLNSMGVQMGASVNRVLDNGFIINLATDNMCLAYSYINNQSNPVAFMACPTPGE